MSKREQSGFTLVEVLVTLVLLGMVAAILFGSLKQVIEARTRLRPYLDQSEQTTMVAGWFRQTVQGLMADYDTGPRRFAATPKDFSGLTVTAGRANRYADGVPLVATLRQCERSNHPAV